MILESLGDDENSRVKGLNIKKFEGLGFEHKESWGFRVWT